jgi:hypothetical protein
MWDQAEDRYGLRDVVAEVANMSPRQAADRVAEVVESIVKDEAARDDFKIVALRAFSAVVESAMWDGTITADLAEEIQQPIHEAYQRLRNAALMVLDAWRYGVMREVSLISDRVPCLKHAIDMRCRGERLSAEGERRLGRLATAAQNEIDEARTKLQTQALKQLSENVITKPIFKIVAKGAVRHYNLTGDFENLPASAATDVPELNAFLDALIRIAIGSCGRRPGELDLDWAADRAVEALSDPDWVVQAICDAAFFNAKRSSKPRIDARSPTRIVEAIDRVSPGFKSAINEYVARYQNIIQTLQARVDDVVEMHHRTDFPTLAKAIRLTTIMPIRVLPRRAWRAILTLGQKLAFLLPARSTYRDDGWAHTFFVRCIWGSNVRGRIPLAPSISISLLIPILKGRITPEPFEVDWIRRQYPLPGFDEWYEQRFDEWYEQWFADIDPLAYEDWLSHTKPDQYLERRWWYRLYFWGTLLLLGWALFWKGLGIANYLLWSAFLRGKVPLSHIYEVGWYLPVAFVLALLSLVTVFEAHYAAIWFVARVVFAWRIHRAR